MDIKTLQKDMIAAMKAREKNRKGCDFLSDLRSKKSSDR